MRETLEDWIKDNEETRGLKVVIEDYINSGNADKKSNNKKRQTNADYICSMSVDQLAEFLSSVKYDGICCCEGQEYPVHDLVWKRWLQSEMEE